ncbi:cytidine deaminase [Ferrigenium kumadai]|uniref:Cytidine deaminase n=1 Tax=Ferrigenium kumadai TaxID=1682490 RepID=A0AAN1SX44_9PROT|nr:anti-phage dCTP deaminase [Ferrigenium kumadai]BBI98438.1 cytidine deaminase [Ferrigenium kumadai]
MTTKKVGVEKTARSGTRRTRKQDSVPHPSSDLASPLTPNDHPELVFGLVGPVGVNLDPVISVLTKELKALNYKAETIRLSKQIEAFFSSDHRKEAEDKRISNLMTEGTRLRTESKRGDAVALLGIAEIMRIREEKFGEHAEENNAYILQSLKHPHEIETLRNVYGKGFFLISVYSPREMRVTALADRISKSQFGSSKNARAKAEELVERDELEESLSLGQDVKDAFPLADLFVDGRNKPSLEAQISRFLQLLFGNVFHTPSRNEHGMYHARSAALRSADLNRQVGAAILTNEGDLVAVGCNEVPKAGGDLYWPGDKGDARDFQKGIDAMAEERTQVLGELLERFSNHGLLSNVGKSKLDNLVQDLVSGNKKDVLKGTRVMNLLEFGRSVHAEMAALMSAARLGISVRGATLFCTTFPCHMCARHIVASGITRVVYVEPYPKSKAKQLHQDSISVDPLVPSTDHVNFEPFEGIAPRRYQDIFDARDSRKDAEGRAIDWRQDPKPRFLRFMNTYRDLETAIVANEIPLLAEKLQVSLSLDLNEPNP